MTICKQPWLVLALLLPTALGCSGVASVSGSVSYDGKAVERGKIRFLPVDDKGDLDPKSEVVGVDIVEGKYAAKNVPMGKKKVAVDAQHLAGQDGKTGDEKASAKQPVEPLIPPEATRDLQVDVNSVNQTLDFNLHKPAAAAGDAGKR